MTEHKMIRFHVTGFDGPQDNGHESVAEALMADFQKILNHFKEGIGKNVDQINVLKQIETKVTSLMGLMNEISDPTVNLDTLAQKLIAGADALKAVISEVANGVFKDELEKSLKSLLTMFKSKAQFSCVAKWYQDLEKFYQLMNGTSGPARTGAHLLQLLEALQADKGNIDKLAKYLKAQDPSSPAADPLMAFSRRIEKLWITIGKIYDRGSAGFTKHTLLEIVASKNKKLADQFIKGLVMWRFQDTQGGGLFGTSIGDTDAIVGLNRALGAIAAFQKEKRPNDSIPLTDYLKLLRAAITDPTGKVQGMLEGIYDTYLDAENAVSQITTQSSSVSEQITTNIYQSLATINAVTKVITNLINSPIQINNLILSYMNRGY